MPITASDARDIAQAIVDGSIWKNWVFYVVVLGGSFIASTLGAFVGSYLKKRGENFATKADFQEILRQLRESTRATEGIRAEIESQYGEAASLRTIVRDRLETLTTATFDLELWFEQMRSVVLRGNLFDIAGSPIGRIESLQSIHFPELDSECRQLILATGNHIQWLLRVSNEARNAPPPVGGQVQIPELANYQAIGRETRDAITTFRTRLIETGRVRGGLVPQQAG